MWTPPLGPWRDIPMGPRNAVLGGGDARGHRHWGHWVTLPMGPRNAVLGGGDACGHRYWGLIGGPPYGATRRRAGWRRRMWTPDLNAVTESLGRRRQRTAKKFTVEQIGSVPRGHASGWARRGPTNP
eukprot:3154098-Pyramimonas_sp.AAC.1